MIKNDALDMAPDQKNVKEPLMEIMEIVSIQKECRKLAKDMTKEYYREYDAIWTEGIRITEELTRLGKEVVAEINRKMPNMLTHADNRPTISEITLRYGFGSAEELADYLRNYEPRTKREERIYQKLLAEKFSDNPGREYEIASSMSPAEILAVVRNCDKAAREISESVYEKYDEVWAGKILISPELLKHGKETVREINRKMPNMLTHDSTRLAIDQVAMLYDFETTQELIDWLLDYTPRVSYQNAISDRLVKEELGLDGSNNDFAIEDENNGECYETDMPPF